MSANKDYFSPSYLMMLSEINLTKTNTAWFHVLMESKKRTKQTNKQNKTEADPQMQRPKWWLPERSQGCVWVEKQTNKSHIFFSNSMKYRAQSPILVRLWAPVYHIFKMCFQTWIFYIITESQVTQGWLLKTWIDSLKYLTYYSYNNNKEQLAFN